MTVWSDCALLGVYTLSPTHYGTGQTTGAVDLPIARDVVTGFPVLPATGIKGVLRDHCDKALGKDTDVLFGSAIGATDADETQAGRLALTEARLLAWPARSLSRPFLHVTCPLIIERLARDLRAMGGENLLAVPELPLHQVKRALVADQSLEGGILVLDDLIYEAAEVVHSPEAKTLAAALASLLPTAEALTAQRLQNGLVVIPDEDFTALMTTAVPVQARISLNEKKTTTGGVGNLWYEEYLPSDCLFVSFIGEKRNANSDVRLSRLDSAAEAFNVIQIGGNETVGHGLCLCTMRRGGGGAS
ncbi:MULTISPECIES: type III-B CRISPR module RAMP protein Cmr4 [unclassified Bradyrhizobium]|uniref:type III-B CRISPR module RAMP protein Cmr4 n=1 Tax=unclassified Bradyrhizobium TaxID=2631580 RepID=UPI0028E97DB1|nr:MULTISPECIES: type III-B CRISPR module RAMP protein Cmr4 [unclassified Bradyrhizobium]